MDNTYLNNLWNYIWKKSDKIEDTQLKQTSEEIELPSMDSKGDDNIVDYVKRRNNIRKFIDRRLS